MKRSLILRFLGVMILFSMSCHNNRLKTSEKELTQDLILQETKNDNTPKDSHSKESLDTLKHSPKVRRFKVNRSIDSNSPPIIIKIAESMDSIKDFKLSNIASEIKYVRIEKVPDSNFSRNMSFKYYLVSNNIIAINPYGILIYTKEGKFIHAIVTNVFTGIKVEPKSIIFSGANTFIGGGTSIWTSGNIISYGYRNSITGQEYIMEYDLSKKQEMLSKIYDPTKPDQIIGQGEVAINMNPSNKIPPLKFKLAPELVMWGYTTDFFYQSLKAFLLDKNTYAKSLERTEKIAMINKQGDTLSLISGFSEDNSFRLEYEGKQFIWNISNDTVFQIIGFNRIVPICIFNLGQKKAKSGLDLNGKITPSTWVQNKNYIFMTFSKDAYDNQRSRNNKSVKIYHALYSKLTKQFFIIKGNPTDYSPEILENNLDGGVPVWPLSYMIGSNGEILLSIKGKDLIDRINSKEFKDSSAPDLKKRELVKLAGLVSESEDILMIIQ